MVQVGLTILSALPLYSTEANRGAEEANGNGVLFFSQPYPKLFALYFCGRFGNLITVMAWLEFIAPHIITLAPLLVLDDA